MRTIFLAVMLCVVPAGVFGQSEATARKIDEFGRVLCGDFMVRAYSIRLAKQENPGSKIYIIYYEEQYRIVRVWNRKLKKNEEKRIGPVKGQALNYAKGVALFLGNSYKFDTGDIVLIDGGFMESMGVEIWIVPTGAEPPKPTPTVDAKDVVFRKGKLRPPRDCTHIYDGL
jgi:hypothetical protein